MRCAGHGWRSQIPSAICLNGWLLMSLSNPTNALDGGIRPRTPPEAAVGHQNAPERREWCPCPAARPSRAEPSPGCCRLIQSPPSTPGLQRWLSPGAAPGLRWGGLSCRLLPERLLSSSSDLSHPPSFAVFLGAAASPFSAVLRGLLPAGSPPGALGSAGVLGIRMGSAGT